ncbi:MAG: glutathione S-transferase [Pseudomonadota bacterium]
MADARTIILHHYDSSPFSEKIRLALRIKNLAWASVEIPVIMPKPDVTCLTGGYRRTPVMQIGADIYCDTSLILRELDQRFPLVPLALPGHEGIGAMAGAWADRVWFQVSVGVIFGAIGDAVPDDFKKDREALSGRPFDTEAMKAAAPMLRDQWRGHLMWIEDRLAGGRGAGAGAYLIGHKPGLADVQAHMNIWFVRQALTDFVDSCFEEAPLTKAWFDRLGEEEGQTPEPLASGEAVEIARAAGPRLAMAVVRAESQDLGPGDRVAVAPDDYGQDWVAGDLVHADEYRVTVRRRDERAETINVHFPRAGYLVRRV